MKTINLFYILFIYSFCTLHIFDVTGQTLKPAVIASEENGQIVAQQVYFGYLECNAPGTENGTASQQELQYCKRENEELKKKLTEANITCENNTLEAVLQVSGKL